MASDARQQYAEDITFVRQAVESRNRLHYGSVAVAVLWGIMIMIGFALSDFNYRLVPWFWTLGGTAAALLTWRMDYRAVRATGVTEHGQRLRNAMHWPIIFVAAVPIFLMVSKYQLPSSSIGPLFALISGIVWYLGGVNLDRRFLAPGAMMIIGSGLIPYLGPYPWTMLGVATGLVLILSAFWMRSNDVETKTTH
jgi:hypothetical protein